MPLPDPDLILQRNRRVSEGIAAAKSSPQYHSSALPWDVVETSGAIHVGSRDQAADMNVSIGDPITLRKAGVGAGYRASGGVTRAISPPPDVPNKGLSELQFNPGAGFHEEPLTDKQANMAHLIHSRENNYARGGSIDESSYDVNSTIKFEDPDSDYSPVNSAVQSLRENKVLTYANTVEGSGQGVSYVVPNPDLNLRQFTEEPKPVAGKSYHQTPLPGIDLAGVTNPGPLDHAFDVEPERQYTKLGERYAPDFSRTRRGRRAPLPAPSAPATPHRSLFE